MKVPRMIFLTACLLLTLAAYYLALFTNWGNPYRGGSPLGTVIVLSAGVLGAFSCWEVFRTERLTPLRATAAAVGVPLALVALLTLWYGVRRYVAA